MNLWIVNHYALPASRFGGTRHYSFARALANRGHRITIIASSLQHGVQQHIDPDNASHDEGVAFHWIRTPQYRGNGARRVANMIAFALQVALLRRAKHQRPDVIVGSSPHLFAAMAAMFLAWRWNIPFVLEVRDLWPESIVKVAGLAASHPLVRLMSLMERKLYRSADAVVSVLPHAVDHIVRFGGKPEATFVVPNGVDFDLVPGSTVPEARKRLVVAYAGSHGVANAIESMIDTAALLQHDCSPAFEFRFYGDGPERRRLTEYAKERGLNHVTFMGPVPKSEIVRRLQEADVLLATTLDLDLYDHGISPNKLMDYLAAGRPIVLGARTPGNLVEVAQAGLIVAPEDSAGMARAIRELAAMPLSARIGFGERGRRYAEEALDIKQLARRFEGAMVHAVRAM